MRPFADLLICLRFFSRLPLPASARETALGPAGLAQAAAMVPLAGAIIGLVPALMLAAARFVGLPSVLAAPIAIVSLVVVTGALHEDGLADCADGFGGGRTRERKLEIMRDSRIGTFGACAIAASLYIRAMALGLIALRAPFPAGVALITAAALSRTACLLPLRLLPPARSDGLGAGAGRPENTSIAIAYAICLALTLVTIALGASPWNAAAAIVASIIAALATCGLAKRQIGGQTGDVAGAAQQCAEIAVLLAFAAAPI